MKVLTSIFYTHNSNQNMNDIPNGKSENYGDIMEKLGYGDAPTLKELFTSASGCTPEQHIKLAKAYKLSYLNDLDIFAAYREMIQSKNKHQVILDVLDKDIRLDSTDEANLQSVFSSSDSLLEKSMQGKYSFLDNNNSVNRGSLEIDYNDDLPLSNNINFYVPNINGTWLAVKNIEDSKIIKPSDDLSTFQLWVTKDQEKYIPNYLKDCETVVFNDLNELIEKAKESLNISNNKSKSLNTSLKPFSTDRKINQANDNIYAGNGR